MQCGGFDNTLALQFQAMACKNPFWHNDLQTSAGYAGTAPASLCENPWGPMTSSITPPDDCNARSYAGLFVNDIPLMDVRAPVEFNRGAFPMAESLPLLDDDQREAVGICYKHEGKQVAIEKGHALVRNEVRQARISAWVAFARRNPHGALYCFRGGLRSQITQQWMHEAGVEFPVVAGGYKALRTFLLTSLERAVEQSSFTLVGGKTGCGKTTLVQDLEQAIDLEAAAYHRGSSFGGHAKSQHTQINFENRLAIDFLKAQHARVHDIVLEDESRTIGRAGLPKYLFEKMRRSRIVVIEEPFDARLQRLLDEYVLGMHTEFCALEEDGDGFEALSAYLLEGLERIRKRLGPARYPGIRNALCEALSWQARTGHAGKHRDWLGAVLENYYDPMYEDQLQKRKDLVCFRGDYPACREYLEHATPAMAGLAKEPAPGILPLQ